jgi:hypothetical protein
MDQHLGHGLILLPAGPGDDVFDVVPLPGIQRHDDVNEVDVHPVPDFVQLLLELPVFFRLFSALDALGQVVPVDALGSKAQHILNPLPVVAEQAVS